MLHITVRLLRPLLRLLLPSEGRHRTTEAHASPVASPPLHSPCLFVLDGEATGLVRSYLVAHERRVEHERRQRRRAGLVLAPQGIGLSEVVA